VSPVTTEFHLRQPAHARSDPRIGRTQRPPWRPRCAEWRLDAKSDEKRRAQINDRRVRARPPGPISSRKSELELRNRCRQMGHLLPALLFLANERCQLGWPGAAAVLPNRLRERGRALMLACHGFGLVWVTPRCTQEGRVRSQRQHDGEASCSKHGTLAQVGAIQAPTREMSRRQ
jgi:hypothetical protein